MYQITTVEDVIAVPPTKFDKDLEQAIKESIAEKLTKMLLRLLSRKMLKTFFCIYGEEEI